MSYHDPFTGILSSLHEAALDDSMWPAASGRIDEACRTQGSTLVMAAGHSQEDARIFFARICRHGERREAWEQSYFDDYFQRDEQIPRVTRLPDGRMTHITDLYTEQERKSSATYNEALRAGGYQNGLVVRLDGPEGSGIYWALAGSTRRGGWGGRQIAMIQSLLPHLRHFLRARHALVGVQAVNASLIRLMDSTRLGIIQLNGRGRVIEANGLACRLLSGGRGLFDKDGFLRARVPTEDTVLQGLLADALPRFASQARGGSMTVSRGPSRSRQMVHVLPVGDRQRNFGIGAISALVLVMEPGSPARLDTEMVGSALGLTETESQVAVALALGKTVSEIAKERGNKLTTGRFHVKQILAKLGLSRQTDLVRLVLSLGDGPGPQRGHPE